MSTGTRLWFRRPRSGSEQVQWRAALEGHDPSVLCSCPGCGERWLVYLAPQQALRIGLLS
jgi:hypothetical protein